MVCLSLVFETLIIIIFIVHIASVYQQINIFDICIQYLCMSIGEIVMLKYLLQIN